MTVPIRIPTYASAFRKLLSVYIFSYFPFGFEGRIWDLIVSVPDHCLSFYFTFQCDEYAVVHNCYNLHCGLFGFPPVFEVVTLCILCLCFLCTVEAKMPGKLVTINYSVHS